MDEFQTIAKILRIRPTFLKKLDAAMSRKTGRKGVIQEIFEKNESLINIALKSLKVREKTGEEIFYRLINRLRNADRDLTSFFGHPNFLHPDSYQPMIDKTLELTGKRKGYFLKEEVAKELLRKNPPPHLLSRGEYRNVKDLLKKESIFEIFANLRLLEGNEWMNNVFLKEYEKLSFNDFEEREVKFIILDRKWLGPAREFVEKKYHNLSHLKELGVVFILPMTDNADGETLRLFSLSLHYLYELDFYSKLFKRYAKEKDFGKKVISLLRGEVLETRKGLKDEDWLIIQRYLAKINKEDPRLFKPHLNPEVIHWEKAEQVLTKFSKEHPEIDLDFWEDLFWEDLDWVGNFYPSQKEGEVLVSFDLIDNIMSLVMEKELIKYLYHQQEALWNRIFEGYVDGREALEEIVIENFIKGYVKLSHF